MVRDPESRYSQGDTQLAVAKYTLAVERNFKRGEEKTADFINCVCFGRSAEFAGKYLCKGMKIAVMGRIQTGSYVNKEGRTVHTTDVVVEEHEFCESKPQRQQKPTSSEDDSFVYIPDNIDDSGLPFN